MFELCFNCISFKPYTNIIISILCKSYKIFKKVVLQLSYFFKIDLKIKLLFISLTIHLLEMIIHLLGLVITSFNIYYDWKINFPPPIPRLEIYLSSRIFIFNLFITFFLIMITLTVRQQSIKSLRGVFTMCIAIVKICFVCIGHL